MKKILKTLFVNILILVFLLCLIEVFSIVLYFNINKNYYFSLDKYLKYVFIQPDNYFEFSKFRKPFIAQDSDKNAIVVMGCSFAYGDSLKENETFSYLLGKYTNRSVYNIATSAASPKEALYIMKNPSKLRKLIPENTKVDYVIYVYVSDQKIRLYGDIYKYSPKFKLNKYNQLVQYKPFFNYQSLFVFKHIARYYTNSHVKETFNLFSVYLKEIQREVRRNFKTDNKYPKFVIFVYEDFFYENWKILKNENNIQIIKLNDIIDVDLQNIEYRISETDPHPSKKIWELLVPLISDELKM